ncbi:hypothetical protein MSKU9_3395 [Komagataeibacter diospyri]|uniref:Uncharacterized protein n=1 Tax=Komagataeibacter diospyri TaxID=1932662 RepID=A0A4P5NY01_9PROT|nr:hypothetical protein MSKU9_3395 [Komagataeibacter diospyri]
MPRHMRCNAAIEGFVHFRFTSGAGAKTQGLQKILRLYGAGRPLIPLSMSTVPCGGSPFGVTSSCTMNRRGPVVTGCGYVIIGRGGRSVCGTHLEQVHCTPVPSGASYGLRDAGTEPVYRGG